MPKEIRVTSTVTRHHPQFSRLVTIPLDKVAGWKLAKTTVVEDTINSIEVGRRSLKKWDERQCWWIDLPESLCKQAGLETGEKVRLVLRLASEELPEELQRLLRNNPVAKSRWGKLTQDQQRMLREDIFSAKTAATRSKRAERVLLA